MLQFLATYLYNKHCILYMYVMHSVMRTIVANQRTATFK